MEDGAHADHQQHEQRHHPVRLVSRVIAHVAQPCWRQAGPQDDAKYQRVEAPIEQCGQDHERGLVLQRRTGKPPGCRSPDHQPHRKDAKPVQQC
jgi:hypothetical protein